jgi:HD-GYP domain-containing protein (c-di-GMP phosphodiesterase class II)
LKQDRFIRIRNSLIRYYREIPLFYETAAGIYRLYKPGGLSIAEMRIAERRHPPLYIQLAHRLDAIRELQKGFNRELSRSIETGNPLEVKTTLVDLVEETLAEPRSGTLQVLPETVNVLVAGYSKRPEILKTFVAMSVRDYSTIIHCINVMALTIGFCLYADMTLKDSRRLGLAALMHDVGKSEIPGEMLQAPRKLTDEEFETIKRHPLIGSEIIRRRNRMGAGVALVALEHHEKLDGSGYPRGTRDISFGGQLVGIIDCYEALTNEDRPYRRAMSPLDTLKLLREDVENGKFSRQIFEKFCYSLV